MADASWDDQASSHQRQGASDLNQHHSPGERYSERNVMGFENAAEPENIGGMQQRKDRVGDEYEGHYHPDDIEAAV